MLGVSQPHRLSDELRQGHQGKPEGDQVDSRDRGLCGGKHEGEKPGTDEAEMQAHHAPAHPNVTVTEHDEHAVTFARLLHAGFCTEVTPPAVAVRFMVDTWPQFTPSHDCSSATVAVPALVTACKLNAGAARATMISVVGPVVVAGVGANVPLGHVFVAAYALEASTVRMSGSRNFAFPLRNFESVCASAAWRFVRVDACEPSFKTERA